MATDKVAYWIDIADEDLGVAEDLYNAKRWLYVAFMCHQAIEKTLKAYWCALSLMIRPILITTRGWQTAVGSIVN